MGKILEINGPLVELELPQTVLGEQVRVGRMGLVGEVIGRDGETALAQLYEDTAGLRPGEPAEGLGWPLSVELGPGLLGAIFDGVQRPLQAMWEQSGDRIARGVAVPSLPRDRRWHFVPDPRRGAGTPLVGGDVLGTVQETESIRHRILTPPLVSGRTAGTGAGGRPQRGGRDRPGEARQRPHREAVPVPPLAGAHAAPVPAARPRRRAADHRPAHPRYLVSAAARAARRRSRAFGAGKTMLQHQIARWCNAEIVIYVGCGERGNELADVLRDVPAAEGPATPAAR